jgi:hypothetical protein
MQLNPAPISLTPPFMAIGRRTPITARVVAMPPAVPIPPAPTPTPTPTPTPGEGGENPNPGF